MIFAKHSNLEGLHAPFSASQSQWLRYDDEKMITSYFNRDRKALGSELHEFAKSQIELMQKATGIKQLVQGVSTYIYSKYQAKEQATYGMSLVKSVKSLPPEVFETLKMHINDAIGFKMSPEVVLYYSDYFFGTADAISFRNNVLRIHDLKTGVTKVDMEQLEVYVALFCLEYKIKPGDIEVELRLYQNGEVIVHKPTAEDILPIMDKIIHSHKLLEKHDYEEV